METVTTQSTIVNFLRTDQKKIDWRFETADSMSNRGETGHKTIYWIAILDLALVDKNQTEYPLNFVTSHGDLKEDRERNRDHDGAPRNGLTTTLYDLSEILPELLIAKQGDARYVHLLIAEIVHQSGQLAVHALVDKDTSGADMLSKPWLRSNEIWPELPTFKTACLSHIDVSKLFRACIRSTRSYNWQK